MTGKPTWLWWSSGKDSAWTLHRLRSDPRYEVTGLVTSVNASAERVAMHAVRIDLLRAQSESVGVPVHLVEIPDPCPNGAYEEAAGRLIRAAEQSGVSCMAFGDLFLEDVRAYRESLLARSPITPVFPLWGLDTKALAREMVDAGVRAHLTCVDPARLAPSFVGRAFDLRLLSDLPPEVEPCGERGEFHTFVSDGPGFSRRLDVRPGQVVERNGVVFADIVPAADSRATPGPSDSAHGATRVTSRASPS